MPHGNAVKKRKDPAPPDSFQKELKAKMRERKKRGLSVDVTPSASERESDDELGSDDGKLGGRILITSYSIVVTI